MTNFHNEDMPMGTVVPLDKLSITRVKLNWYIGRCHGAVFFSRSRSEIVIKHRRWRTERLQKLDQQHQEALAAVRRIDQFRGRAC